MKFDVYILLLLSIVIAALVAVVVTVAVIVMFQLERCYFKICAISGQYIEHMC